MTKKLIAGFMVGIALFGSTEGVSAVRKPAYYDAVPYVVNTVTDVTITRVNIGENKIYLKYDDSGITGGITDQTVDYVQVMWGTALSDDLLLGYAQVYPEDANRVYSKGTYLDNLKFADGVEEEIVSEQNLQNNSQNELIYAVTTVSKDSSSAYRGKYIIGRINYSDCVNSPYYKDGMECRAEASEDGTWNYWPYENGVRVGNSGDDDTSGVNNDTDENGTDGGTDSTDNADIRDDASIGDVDTEGIAGGVVAGDYLNNGIGNGSSDGSGNDNNDSGNSNKVLASDMNGLKPIEYDAPLQLASVAVVDELVLSSDAEKHNTISSGVDCKQEIEVPELGGVVKDRFWLGIIIGAFSVAVLIMLFILLTSRDDMEEAV